MLFNKNVSKPITYEMSTKCQFSHLHFPLVPAVIKTLWFSFLYVHSKEKKKRSVNRLMRLRKYQRSMQLFSLLFVCSLILKEKGTQSTVVQTLDRAIHWINFKETICVIWWKVIYPGYGAIHFNNNWGLVICSADQIFTTTNTFYCMYV